LNDLRKLRGIGPKALQKLSEMGISSLEQLAERSPEIDYQGWALFGRKDEWKRLVIQARSLLVPDYIKPEFVSVGQGRITIESKQPLSPRILVTNILELPESTVTVSLLDNYIITPKKTGSPSSDSYYSSMFNNALLRIPERLKLIRLRNKGVSLDSEQGVVEYQNVLFMERQFEEYLDDLVKNRLERTIEHGKHFKITDMMAYFNSIAGNLYFDSFLSLIQQYALSDSPIVSKGSVKMSTGFNLALMGQPGTGKTFATVDIILGNANESIPAHGLPGFNRYCGGITVAQFIRIGQAYQDKRFNFLIPEFNDWFKYPGMVENLKQALERKMLKYETVNETIGPYRFNSFFTVNYNTHVNDSGYEATIRDPNFNAVEDRMTCRLHKMSKGRFLEILDSLGSHLLGETVFDAGRVRDHLTLVYAIQTSHPLVAGQFPKKDVSLEPEVVSAVTDAAKKYVSSIEGDSVAFSPRLVKRTIQLCCSMALMKYFQSDSAIRPGEEELKYALQFFNEEAIVRMGSVG
jgi:hypothetical protein